MSEYKKIILKNSPIPGAVPLADFLDFGELALNYADKKLYYKELGGDIVVHETPYIDVEGSQNSIVKRNGDGSGVFNGIISDVSDPDLYALNVEHSNGVAAVVSSVDSNTAIRIFSESGIGAEINSESGTAVKGLSLSGSGGEMNSTSGIGAKINSVSGIGAQITSTSGVGAQISSTGTAESSTGLYVSADFGVALQAESQENLGAEISSVEDTGAEIYTLNGDYHLILGRADSGQQLMGISRPNASLDWLKNNNRVGSLKTTATISANCNWTLPDRSGTLLLDSSIQTGKTIFVDAAAGTDTRTGLSAYSYTPFATIGAAVAASTSGDLVYVRAGTYTISSQINLNLKGHLYFDSGATVNVATGVVAFSYSTNNIPIYVKGAADFILTGTAGVLTMPSGNAATSVSFECNSISGPNTASGTLFNCAVGVLAVDAKVIQMTTTFTASNAVVFNITGSGKVTARIPFAYCGVFVNGAGAANAGGAAPAQINADIWTLATYNGTAGMNLNLIVTSFRIVNYGHVGVGAAFSWTENTTIESHVFRGVNWASSPFGAAQMTFASTAGSTSNKRINLNQTNILRAAATYSLSASVPIDVYTYGSFATAPANSNVTFKVGAFTVDAAV
jgi:hypothetical protein